MNYKIKLNNIKIFGFHGISIEEQKNGQNFEIDVVIISSLSDDLELDKLDCVIDYSTVYNYLHKLFTAKRYNLIELLAKDIGDALIDKFKFKSCTIIIRKPEAPMPGNIDSVEVEYIIND